MNITVKQLSVEEFIPVELGHSIMKASEVQTMYKRIYGKNWQYHYHQWKLWNTASGKKAFNSYTKGF